MRPINFWSFEYASHTDEANREIKEIFGEKIFETPKPVSLVKRIMEHCCDIDSIILDSFAGSGTTAHAVLDLNKEDGGNRKFILVECEDYADEITAERVRRVSRGVPEARDEKLHEGLGGTFSYYELGDPIDTDAMLDGSDLPSFENLAKYAFHTATGEKLDIKQLEPKNYYVGSSKTFEVFMIYEPDKNRLKELALNSTLAEQIHARCPISVNSSTRRAAIWKIGGWATSTSVSPNCRSRFIVLPPDGLFAERLPAAGDRADG
jgi:adenine-specific DNA-methyltransferase